VQSGGIEEEAVDGEVAALDVFFGAGGVEDGVRVAAVRVCGVGAEGGDLGHGVARAGIGGVLERRNLVESFVGNENDAKVSADGERAREQVEDDVGCGGGGHVVVDGIAAEQQVADAAAGEQRLVTRSAKGFDDAQGSLELARERGHGSIVSLPWAPGCDRPLDWRVMGTDPARGLILGIESSCDETAAAVVERGARTLSSVVASQIATHARYGGVVPELASREHLRAILPVVRAALAEAGVGFEDLDAIAVTSGPGLAGALLVGITFSKALAFARGLPVIAVNHLEGHIHAVLLEERQKRRESAEEQPQILRLPLVAQDDNHFENADDEAALALVVSGGHTHLYLAEPAQGTWRYRLIGRTLDDAAGEAYDKVAKLLGLGYPGGPWIDAMARFGDAKAVPFSFAQIKTKAHLQGKAPRTKAAKTAPIAELDPHFLFSFSGIKTAVLRHVELNGLRTGVEERIAKVLAGARPPRTKEEALALAPQPVLDTIASFQHAVVGDLLKKTFAAAEALGTNRVLVTGGVAANRELRERFMAEAARRGVRVAFPTPAMSTDNAAMIAAAAWPRFVAGEFAQSALSADPSLALGV
jgi:N6-L-threonylcarbamoyladenine synthase